MCLNQGRPGMPSGLSQLRSTCIMPWLRVRASLGSMGPAESLRVRDALNWLPADSNESMAFLTWLRSRGVAALDVVGEPDRNPWWELPNGPQGAQARKGSFECVSASLRVTDTSLKMTDLFLIARSFTNWRMLLA